MYETQRPSDGGVVDEKALIEETLEQWVLADELGYDYIWLVEHHFLDTFSVSSSPDILFGAASRLTASTPVVSRDAKLVGIRERRPAASRAW